MSFKVEIVDRSRLDQLSADIARDLESDFRAASKDLQAEIVQRTQSGESSDGSRFAPYHPTYRDFKRKALGQSGQPNLTLTGDMLGSITSSVSRGGAGVDLTMKVNGGFNQQKADWVQSGGRSPARRFFAFSDSQVVRFVRKLLRNVK